MLLVGFLKNNAVYLKQRLGFIFTVVMKILFMGTSLFGAALLRSLCEIGAGQNVVGVVTGIDKKVGRGMSVLPSPVKAFAVEKGLPVYQPATLRSDDFMELLREIAPELIIVVAYGKILPDAVLDFPLFGCVNIHGSVLPKYRGAAPIQRAVMNGEKITGVCAMYMDSGIDTGDIINTEFVEISDTDDFGSVHDKMAAAGSLSLVRAINSIRNGTVVRMKQDDSLATYAAKIEREDCLLDFNRDAVALFNQIRGLSPSPLAFTRLPDGKLLKIVSSRAADTDADAEDVNCTPGTVVSLDGGVISVACARGGGILQITEVVPEGKKKMSSADFIRGRKINAGDKFLNL